MIADVDSEAGDFFGTSFSLSGNRALISAIFDDDLIYRDAFE